MALHTYKPNSVKLPEYLMEDEQVASLLFEYMADLGRGDKYNIIQPFRWFLGEQDNLSNKHSGDSKLADKNGLALNFNFLSNSDKRSLLKGASLPLFFDVFWTATGDKLIALGPAMPELWDILGEPIITYQSSKDSDDETILSYRFGDINRRNSVAKDMVYSFAIKYLIIDLPYKVALENKYIADKNSYGQLSLQWGRFSQTISLQPNPFIDDASMITLVTLQKDNPVEWIQDWCLYYYKKHNVKRIILYNNSVLIDNKLTLAMEEVLNNIADQDSSLDICLVVWDCTYQLWFSQCQAGALTHSYWWLMNKASCFLNFDLDEYLVNNTSLGIEEYLRLNSDKGREGLLIPGFDVPNSQEKFRYKTALNPNQSAKTIYRAEDWQLLTPHCIFRKEFFPPPLVWYILVNKETNLKNKIIYFCAKYFYQISLDIFYKLQGLKRRLRMRDNPSAFDEAKFDDNYIIDNLGLYFLHYRNINNNWKWNKNNPHLQPEEFNPKLHSRL